MSLLIGVALRSSVVLLTGLGLLTLLRKRSAAIRHFVLAAAIGTGAAVAPLSLVLPSLDVRVPATRSADVRAAAVRVTSVTVASTGETGGSRRASAVDPGRVLLRMWSAGFLVTAVMLAGGVLRLT